MSALDKLNDLIGHDNAAQAISMASQYVAAYTRGKGFNEVDGQPLLDMPLPDVEAVIVSVAARLMTNPRGISQETAGPFMQQHFKWDGFTLLEQTVLNRYRVRAQ